MALPNPTIDQLEAAVANAVTVVDSAIALINGIAARIQAAVDAALAGGVTAAELASAITDEIDAINAKSSALAAAVQANTTP
jgi:hypothetical protein